MNRHALDAKHYISADSFELERQHLFSKLWIFVGFTSQVAERNQFFTRNIAGTPVLIQRTEAGIRAFVNQCPHRLSAIQTQNHGKRPMVCPYHAWAFGAEGELRGIPNEGLYQFDPREKQKLCLRKLHLQEVGQLVFVNLSPQPISIDEQFTSGFIDKLREASAHLDSSIIYSCHRVRYNWKFNIENVKDYNHIPFIHSKTFSPYMESKIKSLPVDRQGKHIVSDLLDTFAAQPLSDLSYSTKGAITPYVNWYHDLCQVYGDEHVFHDWFVYPNLNFYSVRGEYFALQQYEPVSPGETDYHLWVMTACRKDKRTDFTALLSTLIRAEHKVIGEDTVILERLQAGLGTQALPFTHGDYEDFLVRQHLWYRQRVLGESA